MVQQINLSSPALQAAPMRFSARSLAQALVAMVVVVGALSAAYVWNLGQSAASYSQIAATQAQQVTALKVALEAAKASAAPVDPVLAQQEQAARAQLNRRMLVKQALLDGRLQPGAGHSDRLLLVARSIPDPVWVTAIKADASRLEVTGLTLEPAALNQWVARLAASPLLQGLQLATFQIENTARIQPASTAGAAAARPQWSFTLVSAQPQPTGAEANTTGAKP